MEQQQHQALSLLRSLPPGFGFHPTDVELISYLRKKVHGHKIDLHLIADIDIYNHEPWDLSAKCTLPSSSTHTKWHFFTPRDRKYPNGSRANRATKLGYWKSTGKDRNIRHCNQLIGTKKTLVFHQGRPPSGRRTQWIMHEYYLDANSCKDAPHLKDLFVLCRVTKRDNELDDHKEHSEPKIPLPNPLPDADADTATVAAADTAAVADTEVLLLDDQSSGMLNPVIQHNLPTLSETTVGSTNTNDNRYNNININYQNQHQEDIDNWLQELFDPNFTTTSVMDQQYTALPVGSNPSAPKPEPTYYSPGQGSEDETSFLLQEDIQSILGTYNQDNTQNLQFLENDTDLTGSGFYCNVVGYSNGDDNDNETGIVTRRRSTTASYDNDESKFKKYNLNSKLQVHLYKKEEKSLEMANFAPKDGLVGEYDNSENISGKDGNELKSTMTERTKIRGLIFGAVLVGGLAMLFYLVSNNSTIFS